jgi:hypothetical protein
MPHNARASSLLYVPLSAGLGPVITRRFVRSCFMQQVPTSKRVKGGRRPAERPLTMMRRDSTRRPTTELAGRSADGLDASLGHSWGGCRPCDTTPAKYIQIQRVTGASAPSRVRFQEVIPTTESATRSGSPGRRRHHGGIAGSGRLRLGAGVNRPSRSGRHWRALLRQKGTKSPRHFRANPSEGSGASES